MMWVIVIAAAVLAFVVIAVVLKAPRKGWELIAAALLLGTAGYALQGRPNLPGAPTLPPAASAQVAAIMVDARRELSGKQGLSANRWIVVADAMARRGQFANAATVLLGAVKEQPDNAEAWLALANALVGHADGYLTPAALHAYEQAQAAAPDAPGAPYFLGLALAQSGRLGEGRAMWADLLAKAPPDAPWRGMLAGQIIRLDEFTAAQAQVGQGR